MKPNFLFRAGSLFLALPAFCFLQGLPCVAMPQENTSAARSADSPPRYINVVHQTMKPGRAAAYDGVESSIRRGYERFDIAAYWTEMKSITGPDESFALNFFESFDDAGKMAGAIGSAVAAHPELAALQDRLLEENVSSVTNFFAERVDSLSLHPEMIHFAKMRLLVVAVFHVYPGHEVDFAEAVRSLSGAFQRVEGTPAWVMYAVIAGAPTPSYVMLTPLNALKDEDAAAARRGSAMEAAGVAVQQRLQDIARSAYQSVETNMYFVIPGSSHMPKDFTALDPIYWQANLGAPAEKH